MALQLWAPLTKDLRQQGFDGSRITNHGATFESGGPFGGYYNFDGVDDYISGGVPLSGMDMTFSLWVNFPTKPTGFHVLDVRQSNGSNGYQPMYVTATQIQIGNTTNGFTDLNYTWEVNTWYHICVTNNSSTTYCYINGELLGSGANGGYNYGVRQLVTLGSRCNQGTYAKMKACDLRIYNECLTSSQVSQLAAGLILYYDFSKSFYNARENLLIGTQMTTIDRGNGTWTANDLSGGNPCGWYNAPPETHTFYNGTDTIDLSYSTGNLGLAFIRRATDFSLNSGLVYTLSCEAKCTKPNASLCIGLSRYKTDGTWDWRGGANPQAFTNTTNWQKFSISFVPASGTQFIDYCFTVVGVTDSNYTLSIRHCKLEQSGVIDSPFDTVTYTEPDGSVWARVFHHNNPGTTGMFASTDTFSTGVYKDSNRWYDVERVCNKLSRFEIMVKQKTTSDATEVKYRWVQTTNPTAATYTDVQPSAVTRNTSSGYTDGGNGGLYLMNSSARCCIANATSGNWFGAAGSWTTYQGGFPGYPNTVITTGYMDIYVRIDDTIITDSSIESTLWQLSPEDTNYDKYCVNPGVQYDLSGFRNHGKRVGHICYDYATRYSYFSNDVQKIQTPDLSDIINEGEFPLLVTQQVNRNYGPGSSTNPIEFTISELENISGNITLYYKIGTGTSWTPLGGYYTAHFDLSADSSSSYGNAILGGVLSYNSSTRAFTVTISSSASSVPSFNIQIGKFDYETVNYGPQVSMVLNGKPVNPNDYRVGNKMIFEFNRKNSGEKLDFQGLGIYLKPLYTFSPLQSLVQNSNLRKILFDL